MNSRGQKQLVIAFVTLVVLVALGFLFWRVFVFESPSCKDNIKNQNEVGVDCGGTCAACVGLPQPVVVHPTISLVAESDTYHVVFRLENPNPQWGVKTLPYRVILENRDGQVIAERQGETFLLSLQKHPVVEQGITLTRIGPPVRARVELQDPVWEEIPEKARNDAKDAQLVVLSPSITRLSTGPYFAEVRGVVRNDSPFSYDRVTVPVIITDRSGKVIGLRETEMRTLTSGQRREFVAAWRVPFELTASSRIEVVALTNVFENENFVKTHGAVEQFQKLQ